MSYDMIERLRRLGDPILALYQLRARLTPDKLFERYGALARAGGFRKLYFVLSFDCDTKEDADVAWSVHERLMDIGVMPVYAVPGELLNRGAVEYRRIRESGAEFINHGFREHTYFDASRGGYASTFFYNRQSQQAVREDIVAGDRNLRENFGVTPQGFRAPHFGTFQRPDQLRFQHRVLKELGYAFSTSTVPLYAYRFGPAFSDFGLIELPVSGMGSRPLRILDSWTCFEAPSRHFGPQDYLEEARRMADCISLQGVGVLNFYADPSHIHDQPEFFDAVTYWAALAQPVTYSQLLAELI